MALEVTSTSPDVEDAIVHISTAPKDVADAPAADPMTRMWIEAVAEWQRKARIDLTAPEATLFSSKEALASYVAKMEADSQGATEMNKWGRLRNTLFPLARIVAKLCGPIGDTLSSTVSGLPLRKSHRVMYPMAGFPSQQSDVCGNGIDNQRVFIRRHLSSSLRLMNYHQHRPLFRLTRSSS